jgi:hypothetical protein
VILELIEAKLHEATIIVTSGELALLANALNEAREEIEEWEFSTRLGVPVEEAEKLRAQIVAALDRLR